MLIFGGSVGDWREKAAYALDKADNDFAEVREIRCEGIDDVYTSMAFMAALANDTKCKDFIYHLTINLYRGERLNQAQWFQIIDDIEKQLGLKGHYRIAFEHIKKDRQHYHLYWFRLPPGNGGAAVNMGHNYRVHDDVAIKYEKEFGLKQAPRKQKGVASHKNEDIRSRNNTIRVDPSIVKKDVTQIYHSSKSGKDFVRNLGKAGYTLTRSKKGKLVLVDAKGGYHGLTRRIEGVTASGLRSKFPELEKMALPSLSPVLRHQRPPSIGSFRKAASTHVSRTQRSSRTVSKAPRRSSTKTPNTKTQNQRGHNPYVTAGASKPRKLSSAINNIRLSYKPTAARKYYPAPLMRKRPQKGNIENKPAKGGVSRADIENMELLGYAWDNHRSDLLAQFGIYILPENAPPCELTSYGIIPPEALEP